MNRTRFSGTGKYHVPGTWRLVFGQGHLLSKA